MASRSQERLYFTMSHTSNIYGGTALDGAEVFLQNPIQQFGADSLKA